MTHKVFGRIALFLTLSTLSTLGCSQRNNLPEEEVSPRIVADNVEKLVIAINERKVAGLSITSLVFFCNGEKDKRLASAFEELDSLEELTLDGASDWEVGLVGGLRKLHRLDLSEGKMSDASLESLKGIPSLREVELGKSCISDAGVYNLRSLVLTFLGLGRTKITDKALVTVGKFRTLEWLDLYHTNISDEGIASLGCLANLVSLDASGTAVTDQGLAFLADQQNLRDLELNDTKVGDRVLEYLKNNKRMNYVTMDNTSVTDKGLAFLHMENLVSLSLCNTLITDKGARYLENLRKAHTLRLRGTNITDTGLKSLEGLIHLRGLDLTGSKGSARGYSHLSEALQSTSIVYDRYPNK